MKMRVDNGTVLLAVSLFFLCFDAYAVQTQSWSDFLSNEALHEPQGEIPHETCFRRAAAAYTLPLSLLLAVARGESGFDVRAVSSAQALGLMQILWPGTAYHLGIRRKRDLFKPCINIDAGARYLKEMLTRYDGNLHRALAAYNYGPGRIALGQDALPAGAQKYSAYIYAQLDHVLRKHRANTDDEPALPIAQKKLQVIVFSAPFRARAFIAKLESRLPGVRLQWYRIRDGRSSVMLLYDSETELVQGKRLLQRAGFLVDKH